MGRSKSILESSKIMLLGLLLAFWLTLVTLPLDFSFKFYILTVVLFTVIIGSYFLFFYLDAQQRKMCNKYIDSIPVVLQRIPQRLHLGNKKFPLVRQRLCGMNLKVFYPISIFATPSETISLFIPSDLAKLLGYSDSHKLFVGVSRSGIYGSYAGVQQNWCVKLIESTVEIKFGKMRFMCELLHPVGEYLHYDKLIFKAGHLILPKLDNSEVIQEFIDNDYESMPELIPEIDEFEYGDDTSAAGLAALGSFVFPTGSHVESHYDEANPFDISRDQMIHLNRDRAFTDDFSEFAKMVHFQGYFQFQPMFQTISHRFYKHVGDGYINFEWLRARSLDNDFTVALAPSTGCTWVQSRLEFPLNSYL